MVGWMVKDLVKISYTNAYLLALSSQKRDIKFLSSSLLLLRHIVLMSVQTARQKISNVLAET